MTWRVRWAVLLVGVLAATGSLWAADLPWVGQWKINVAKSDFGQSTITYGAAGPDEMQWTADGQTMKFKMDGKEYTNPFGGTAIWKKIDASTWETVNKTKDQVVSTETSRLSADGKTMTVGVRGTRPNGKAFENEYVLTRVSGGPGLLGTWKTAKVSLGAPSVVELTPFENDGLTLRIVDTGTTWSAKFDGKDNPVKGSTVPEGYTVALRRTGPRSFDYTQKLNGKLISSGSNTVSADGKTFTGIDTASGTSEKTTAVYDRQ